MAYASVWSIAFETKVKGGYTESGQRAWALGPWDSSFIWQILKEAQEHYNTTVDCYHEAEVKVGDMQKLDSMHGQLTWVLNNPKMKIQHAE